MVLHRNFHIRNGTLKTELPVIKVLDFVNVRTVEISDVLGEVGLGGVQADL